MATQEMQRGGPPQEAKRVIVKTKKPLTLKERMALAKRAQAFAKARVDKLNAKAAAMAEAGDPKAAQMQAIADKAVGSLGAANAKVETITNAAQKKAAYLGAKMAESAARLAIFKRNLEDRKPGGKLSFDSQNSDEYQRLIAQEEAKIKGQIAKADQFESSFGIPGAVAEAAEEHGKQIIQKMGERAKAEPDAWEPPPTLEAMNKSMGLPPGGMKEVNAINEAAKQQEQNNQAAQGGDEGNVATPPGQAGQKPANQGGMQDLSRKAGGPEMPTKAAPTQNKSNLGGAQEAKPQLQRGELGGWYYETKSGQRVYVQK